MLTCSKKENWPTSTSGSMESILPLVECWTSCHLPAVISPTWFWNWSDHNHRDLETKPAHTADFLPQKMLEKHTYLDLDSSWHHWLVHNMDAGLIMSWYKRFGVVATVWIFVESYAFKSSVILSHPRFWLQNWCPMTRSKCKMSHVHACAPEAVLISLVGSW